MKMCSAFAACGAEIQLAVPLQAGDGGGGVDVDPCRYYDIANPFPLVRLGGLPLCKRSYAFALRIFGALRRGRFRPDLVYSRDLLGGFAALLAGYPLVLEIHHPMRASGWLHGRLFEWIVRHRNFTRLVVITHALKGWHLRESRIAPDKILVAPDGADLPRAVPEVPCPVEFADTRRFRVAYVGSLYDGKGLEVVVPLARLLPEMDFHVLGGSGELLQHWRQLTAADANLFFHGYCPPSVVAPFLDAMDVLLVPNQRTVHSVGGSEIGRWTSPLKLFEYMAAGKPIVASDLEVLREILVHEGNCLLCPPEDLAAWKQALERLHDDRQLAERIAANARTELSSRYTWERRAKRLLDSLAIRT
jgi:glycosyltransferase involved in cell wall biosynthesis